MLYSISLLYNDVVEISHKTRLKQRRTEMMTDARAWKDQQRLNSRKDWTGTFLCLTFIMFGTCCISFLAQVWPAHSPHYDRTMCSTQHACGVHSRLCAFAEFSVERSSRYLLPGKWNSWRNLCSGLGAPNWNGFWGTTVGHRPLPRIPRKRLRFLSIPAK